MRAPGSRNSAVIRARRRGFLRQFRKRVLYGVESDLATPARTFDIRPRLLNGAITTQHAVHHGRFDLTCRAIAEILTGLEVLAA